MTTTSSSSMSTTGPTSQPRTLTSAVELYRPSRTEERGAREKKQDRSTGFSWVHFMAGGAGGMVGALVTSPLDVVKTRLQSSLYKDALSLGTGTHTGTSVRPTPVAVTNAGGGRAVVASARSGVTSVIVHVRDTFRLLGHIYTNEGPRALYKGLGPNLVGVIPARAINFAAYGNGKKFFSELNHGNEAAIVHLAAAANAGVVTATMTNPIWMVKTRMQLQSEGNKRIYRNSFHCVVEILRTEGLRGLYKGLSASYLGVAEGTIQWVVYENLKTRFAQRRRADQVSLELRAGVLTSHQKSQRTLVGGKGVEEWMDYLGAAGIAKFIASAITYPHEVLRTRMRQTPEKGEVVRYTGLRQTFGLILKEEGVGALYGGLTAHMLRVVPNAAIMFFCYEAILHRFS
ncbi:mitochondrial carrier [Linnemannia elongata AG-77]|uniref:Mitochondrial carrier n=1 Tax=Linnemannia elongata AG-77 TaxID=1314771 RepID=A0A197JVC2_9FUNG|nr:mitochondrial carrier [Linnemannia elongata AG-77]